MVPVMADMWGVYNLVNEYIQNQEPLEYLLRLWFCVSVVGFLFGFLLAFIKRIFFTAAR